MKTSSDGLPEFEPENLRDIFNSSGYSDEQLNVKLNKQLREWFAKQIVVHGEYDGDKSISISRWDQWAPGINDAGHDLQAKRIAELEAYKEFADKRFEEWTEWKRKILQMEIIGMENPAVAVRLKEATARLEKEKAELAAEVARLHEKYDMQFLVKNNNALKARVDELESITEFACLTGDCDHSTQVECNLAAFRLLNDLKKAKEGKNNE